jgi:hypothetical protein
MAFSPPAIIVADSEKTRRQRDFSPSAISIIASGEKTSEKNRAIYRWKNRWNYRSCIAGLTGDR